MALLETLCRADSKLAKSFKEEEFRNSLLQDFFSKVGDNIASGACAIRSTLSRGTASVSDSLTSGASAVSDSFSSTAGDVTSFFRSISVGSGGSAGGAAAAAAAEGASARSSVTEPDVQSFSAPPEVKGVYGVDYSKYPIGAYVKLPAALQPFINLPGLDHYLVVARPTMDKSGGLAGYRDVVPKSVRAAAPFLIIVDEPGKTVQDKSYLWYEFKLVDVFKLDVAGMRSFDDYLAKLSRKSRWNCKDRQKKLKSSPLSVEYIPLPRDRAFLDTLWPLYQQTGEKNGFCVLGEAEFFEFHAATPDLTVMLIRDSSQGGRLVTFCTGVRAGDTLMPMWCGTDYEHELCNKCSTYFNMLYEYVKVAIADPTINWVDLGATRRAAKTSIGFEGYNVSGYVRCKNNVMLAIIDTMMKEYFRPEELMNDP